MRFKICIAVAALICSGLGQSAMAQNQFGNPGFEDPITFDGPPFIGSWEGFLAADPAEPSLCRHAFRPPAAGLSSPSSHPSW